MVHVEQGWLAALVSAGIAPPAAKAGSRWAVGPADVDEIAAAAEAGGNPVIPLVSLLRGRARRSTSMRRRGCTAG